MRDALENLVSVVQCLTDGEWPIVERPAVAASLKQARAALKLKSGIDDRLTEQEMAEVVVSTVKQICSVDNVLKILKPKE